MCCPSEECALANGGILRIGADLPGKRLDRRARVAEADITGNGRDFLRPSPFRYPCVQSCLDTRSAACLRLHPGRRQEGRSNSEKKRNGAVAKLHHVLPRLAELILSQVWRSVAYGLGFS